MLELSSDENRIRRLGNKALPQLKLLAKKRQPDQDVEAVVDEEKKFDPYYINNIALFLRFILIKILILGGKKFKMNLRGSTPISKSSTLDLVRITDISD
jgi:hypothetical protein